MVARSSTAERTAATDGCGPSTAGTEPCCTPLMAAPLDEGDAAVLARRFAALSDPVRLQLLSLIASAGEACSCDLLEPVGRSQPTVSHHTKVLADAGLLVGEKRGRWTWWRVEPTALDDLRAVLDPR